MGFPSALMRRHSEGTSNRKYARRIGWVGQQDPGCFLDPSCHTPSDSECYAWIKVFKDDKAFPDNSDSSA